MPIDPAYRIGFIGAGRVGMGLAWGLARKGWRVEGIASRSETPARKLAAAIPDCRVHGDAQALADAADLVMLAVPDDAIATVCARIRWRRGQSAVHCAGAAGLEALSDAVAQGAQAGGFHPLQMFTDPETALRGLPGCTVAIEAEPPLFDTLAAMADTLDCHTLRVPPGARVLYHAGAGYVAAFVNALAREAYRMWGPLGLTEAEAMRALLPLLRGTADSIERLGPARGMAGPVSRGDVGTVRRHIEAIGTLDSDALELYRAIALRTVALGIERGSLSAEKAEELRALLAPRRT